MEHYIKKVFFILQEKMTEMGETGDGQRGVWEERLRQPDAIMEPDVVTTIQHFLSEEGGKPETTLGLLVGSYRGLAQMANLVGEWLFSVGESRKSVQGIVTDVFSKAVVDCFDPAVADALFMKVSVCLFFF